jgi:K+-transporting ATPase ATPase B chain
MTSEHTAVLSSSGSAATATRRVGAGLLDPKLLWRSLPDALRKLDPRTLWRNPVMFVVEVGSIVTTVLAVLQPSVFAWAITLWLWLTVVFANLAEAGSRGPGEGAGGDFASSASGDNGPPVAGVVAGCARRP